MLLAYNWNFFFRNWRSLESVIPLIVVRRRLKETFFGCFLVHGIPLFWAGSFFFENKRLTISSGQRSLIRCCLGSSMDEVVTS